MTQKFIFNFYFCVHVIAKGVHLIHQPDEIDLTQLMVRLVNCNVIDIIKK